MQDQVSLGTLAAILAGALLIMSHPFQLLIPGNLSFTHRELWMAGITAAPESAPTATPSGRLPAMTTKVDEHALPSVDYGNYTLQFKTLDEKLVALTDFAGNVVLVNFWAPWCTPCRLETPGFVRTYEKYKGAGFVILGIGVKTNEKDAQAFVKQYGIHYPVGLQPESAIFDKYGVYGIPSSFLFAPDGKLYYRFDGFTTESQLEKKIEELLREAH